MRGAVVLKAMALLVAVAALGGVMVSGRQLLGAAPGGEAGVVSDAGVRADGGRSAGVSSVFGTSGNVYAPASKSFGAMGGLDQGFGGLGLRGSGGSSDGGVRGIGTMSGGGIGSLPRDSATEPVVMGSLDKEVIRQVIHAARGQIRSCYEKQPPETKFEGKLTVKFVISPQGSVASAQVAQSTFNPPLPDFEACIARVIRGLQFPPPKGGGVVVVTYPFIIKVAAP